jgi:hypothetical protein
VRSVLLKGPAVARWLYRDDPAVRSYVDVDLLVSVGSFPRVTAVLSELGFELSLAEVALPHGRRPHAETWERPGDGFMVDLHSTLPGVGVAPELAWRVLAADTAAMTVGGAEVEVLGEPARALLVALHAAHHGVKEGQTREDLSRALAQVPVETWGAAYRVAERLKAIEALSSGLRLLPAGAELASELGLPVADSVEAVLRAGSAPELALSFDWLVNAPSSRARARLIARKLVPPAGVLKARSPLARRGPAGLVVAYAVNPFVLAWRGGPALRAWVEARREAHSSRRPPEP